MPLGLAQVHVGMAMRAAVDRENKSCRILTMGAWGATNLSWKAPLGRYFRTKPSDAAFVPGQTEVLKHIV